MSTLPSILCFVCGSNFNTTRSLITHIKITHNVSHYECHKDENCTRKFSDLENYRKHRLRDHKEIIIPENVHSCNIESNTHHSCNEIIEDNYMDVDDLFESPLGNNDDSAVYLPDSFEHLFKNDVLQILSIFFSYKDMPKCRVEDIMKVISKHLLNGDAFQSLKNSISRVSHNSIENHQIFEDFNSIPQIFDNNLTNYKQTKLVMETGKFVEPESYKIGERKDYKEVNGKRIEVTRDLTAEFVPLRHTLKHFFELENVAYRTLSYMQELYKSSNIIENFIQGEYWKSLISNSNHDDKSTLIPLIVYFDEFEVDNPLGSHAGINKVGGIYASVPCLPVELQSKIENILLVILFNVDDRKNTEDEFLLVKLVEELKFLENNGITVQINEEKSVKFFFKLALIVGDNLGVHSLLGFVESFVANFPCRFCQISRDQLQIVFDEEFCIIRNQENYHESLLKNDMSRTGIKFKSIFNEIESFHVTQGTCVDAMHDWDGIVKYDLSEILYNYIFEKKYFTVQILNSRLNGFQFDANHMRKKPPCFTEKQIANKNIRMSFSEISCFLEIITLAIGDHVPNHDPLWSIILYLRKIHYIIFSSQFQVEICDYLKTLISEYLSLLKESNFHLRPKHHFLIHYPRLLNRMGPLKKLSSLRYESKHRFNKFIANATTSRKNICHTIASKNQFVFNQRCLTAKVNYSIFQFGPFLNRSLNFENFYINNEQMAPLKYFMFYNKQIKEGKHVLMRPSSNNDIELFAIKSIYGSKNNKNIIMKCEKLEFSYDLHYDSFQILSKLPDTVNLTNEHLFESVITYMIDLNGVTHILKRWS